MVRMSKKELIFLLALAGTGASVVSLFLLNLTACTTASISAAYDVSAPKRLAPPPTCVEPLRPGEEGECWFHSQKFDTARQDEFVFKMLGGKIDQASCTSAAKFCLTSEFSQEVQKCKCTAPPSPSAFGRNFMEIGAADGLYLSNTAFFEYQMGWTGVCIEASPISFQKLRQNRPNCKSFNAVVGKAFKGKNSTFLSFVKYGGWEIGLSGMLGGELQHLSSIEGAKKYADSIGATLQVDQIPGVLLSDLYEEAGMRQIDWASVDVEGHEASVLETWDVKKVPIGLLTSEDRGITGVIKDWGLKEIRGPAEPALDVWYVNRRVISPLWTTPKLRLKSLST